jgi:hypothetical protein
LKFNNFLWVYSYAKIFLFLYPLLENSTTNIAIITIYLLILLASLRIYNFYPPLQNRFLMVVQQLKRYSTKSEKSFTKNLQFLSLFAKQVFNGCAATKESLNKK